MYYVAYKVKLFCPQLASIDFYITFCYVRHVDGKKLFICKMIYSHLAVGHYLLLLQLLKRIQK